MVADITSQLKFHGDAESERPGSMEDARPAEDGLAIRSLKLCHRFGYGIIQKVVHLEGEPPPFSPEICTIGKKKIENRTFWDIRGKEAINRKIGSADRDSRGNRSVNTNAATYFEPLYETFRELVFIP